MTHVPYKGVAPLTTDLVGNNIEFGVFVLSSGLPHIKAGKVVALGTTEAKRSLPRPIFRPCPSCPSSRTWTSTAGLR
jgi:tripartite-type tricarboxylate transporter receptor subunit TctC